MELRKLNTDETTFIYNEYMKVDFPPYELKSLKKMLRLTSEGKYQPLGIYENNDLVGYAYLVNYKNFVILDHFAILKEKRNGGFGATAINLIADYCKDKYDILVLEADDPDFFQKQEDKDLCNRRLGFYKRNNFTQVMFKVTAYEADFIILGINDRINDVEKLAELYIGLYVSITNEQKCKENVSLEMIVENKK